MGGISGGELVVLLLVGFLVVGPEKLPELSRQLARVVRKVVAVARDTGDKVRAELGDDLDDLKSLDPRQYDPRRIVADAMKEPARTARRETGPTTQHEPGAARARGDLAPVAAGAALGRAGVGGAAQPVTGGTHAVDDRPRDAFDGGRPAPYDPDAT